MPSSPSESGAEQAQSRALEGYGKGVAGQFFATARQSLWGKAPESWLRHSQPIGAMIPDASQGSDAVLYASGRSVHRLDLAANQSREVLRIDGLTGEDAVIRRLRLSPNGRRLAVQTDEFTQPIRIIERDARQCVSEIGIPLDLKNWGPRQPRKFCDYTFLANDTLAVQVATDPRGWETGYIQIMGTNGERVHAIAPFQSSDERVMTSELLRAQLGDKALLAGYQDLESGESHSRRDKLIRHMHWLFERTLYRSGYDHTFNVQPQLHRPDGKQIVRVEHDGILVRVPGENEGKRIATGYSWKKSHDATGALNNRGIAAIAYKGWVDLWNTVTARTRTHEYKKDPSDEIQRPIESFGAHGKTDHMALAFGADGDRLVTGGGDGYVKVWSVPPA